MGCLGVPREAPNKLDQKIKVSYQTTYNYSKRLQSSIINKQPSVINKNITFCHINQGSIYEGARGTCDPLTSYRYICVYSVVYKILKKNVGIV